MILLPAIDLKDGVCVRLKRGDFADATVYDRQPLRRARQFAAAGCRWLHLVDLDGAASGASVNGKAARAIIAGSRLKVQLGGGIRSLKDMETWLERGVSRLVVGTLALNQPQLLREACRRFPARIAAAIDSRDGRAAAEGWTKTSSVTSLELALRLEDCGAAAIIHTDIQRDGVFAGLNLEATRALAEALSTPLIASGGLAGIDDLRAIKAMSREKTLSNLAGVIAGRALYEGRIALKQAVALLEGDDADTT